MLGHMQMKLITSKKTGSKYFGVVITLNYLRLKTNMIQMVYFIVIIVLVVNIGNRMACVESDS